MTHEEFLIKLEEKYPKKFEILSKYERAKTRIKVKHLECGKTFEILAYKLLDRGSTPCCNIVKKTHDQFLEEVKNKFGNQYTILNKYTKSNEKIKAKCNYCGKITNKIANDFLRQAQCECINKNNSEKNFLNDFNKRHQNKFKLLSEYSGYSEKIKIKCNDCGYEYFVKATYARNVMSNCIKCSGVLKKTQEEFEQQVEKISNGEYSVLGEYINDSTKIFFMHNKCFNMYQTTPNAFLRGVRCPKCNYKGTSNKEQQLIDFIKNNYNGTIILNDRKLISKELDIYLPELKIAFEFNGLYWHSHKQKEKNYHLDKTEKAEKKQVQLIHIFEDEWDFKQEIVKSKILNYLHKTPNKIFARKCIFKRISNKEKDIFLNLNHIQGTCVSSINYGLEYNGEILAVMTFSKLRNSMLSSSDNSTHEMVRYATKLNYNIVGGFTKLLNNILKEETSIEKIKTFADRRWSTGNVYIKNNFIFSHNSNPNYFYFSNNSKDLKRQGRMNFQKHKLSKILKNFDVNKTEIENMEQNNYLRIFDCGSKVYFKSRH